MWTKDRDYMKFPSDWKRKNYTMKEKKKKRWKKEKIFYKREKIVNKWGFFFFLIHEIALDQPLTFWLKPECKGTSLVAQWLRIHLPMQGTWVRVLVQEDPTCCRATKPMCHNYWACALEPTSHSYWARAPQLPSPRAATTEARVPRARALQREKPPQWEACAPQRRPNAAKNNK